MLAYVIFYSYLCTLFMQINELEIVFSEHPQVKDLCTKIEKKRDTHLLLSGLHASARALLLAQLKAPLFVIFDNAEAAQYLYADLKTLNADVAFFPAVKKRRSVDEAAQVQRTETLTTLPSIIVTYPEAIVEPVPTKEELVLRSLTVKVGQEIQ